jgi:hypothetical protein
MIKRILIVAICLFFAHDIHAIDSTRVKKCVVRLDFGTGNLTTGNGSQTHHEGFPQPTFGIKNLTNYGCSFAHLLYKAKARLRRATNLYGGINFNFTSFEFYGGYFDFNNFGHFGDQHKFENSIINRKAWMNNISLFIEIFHRRGLIYISQQLHAGVNAFNSKSVQHTYNERIISTEYVSNSSGGYLVSSTTEYSRKDKYTFSNGLMLGYKFSLGLNIRSFSVYGGLDAAYVNNDINFSSDMDGRSYQVMSRAGIFKWHSGVSFQF